MLLETKGKLFLLSLALSLSLILIAGCAISNVSNAPISGIEGAELLYDEAAAAQHAEEHQIAATKFEEFVSKYPQSQDADNAQLAIGDNYFHLREYNKAIEAYQTVIQKYPTSDSADITLLRLGDAHMALDNQTEASKAYWQLIQKYPNLEIEVAVMAQSRIKAIEEIQNDLQIIANGEDSQKDNAQYHIAQIYFERFQNYDKAIEEFKKVVDKYPDSELADNAAWMIGECYWAKGGHSPLPVLSKEALAFIRLQRIFDRYPQLSELDRYDVDGYPHWPAGRRGDRYELYFAEVRRLLNRYPDLKQKKWPDFVSPEYGQTIQTWERILQMYPNSDAASQMPRRMAERLLQLGRGMYNIGVKGGYADFASLIFKASLEAQPTPEAHLYLARYYADLAQHTPWLYYRTRAFNNLDAAEALVPPGSQLAAEVKDLKTFINYRLRLEALESVSRGSHRK
jgi:tol-pal system protein YbgF